GDLGGHRTDARKLRAAIAGVHAVAHDVRRAGQRFEVGRAVGDRGAHRDAVAYGANALRTRAAHGRAARRLGPGVDVARARIAVEVEELLRAVVVHRDGELQIDPVLRDDLLHRGRIARKVVAGGVEELAIEHELRADAAGGGGRRDVRIGVGPEEPTHFVE